MFDSLLKTATNDSFSCEELRHWASLPPNDGKELADLLDEFALYVAERYLDRSLNFDDVNDALNQVMAVCNFEAPLLFWEVYVAFEDFEVSDDPDSEARPKVKEIVNKLRVSQPLRKKR